MIDSVTPHTGVKVSFALYEKLLYYNVLKHYALTIDGRIAAALEYCAIWPFPPYFRSLVL